jgi:hypothetical protein
VPVTGAHVAPDTDAKTQNRPNAAVDPNPAVGPDLTVDPDPVAIITEMARTESDDADLSVSRVASVTLAGPLIKVAALSHGLRRALDEESRMRIGYAVRKELKRQRKMRRRRRSGRAPSKGWTS